MAGFETVADLIADVLFRAGEPNPSSDFQTAVLRYLDRAQQIVCLGGAQFGADLQEDWPWLRQTRALTLQGNITQGQAEATAGQTTVVVLAPTLAVEITQARGWQVAIGGTPVTVVAMAGQQLTLATIWAGATGVYPFTAALGLEDRHHWPIPDPPLGRITSPAHGFQADGQTWEIALVDPAELWAFRFGATNPQSVGLPRRAAVELWGPPDVGAREWPQTLAIDRMVPDDTTLTVFLYTTVTPPALTGTPDDDPLIVPARWRPVLADLALYYLLMDKNDDRAVPVSLAVRAGLQAMQREQAHVRASTSPRMGALTGITPARERTYVATYPPATE
jgi:hypothetical protein